MIALSATSLVYYGAGVVYNNSKGGSRNTHMHTEQWGRLFSLANDGVTLVETTTGLTRPRRKVDILKNTHPPIPPLPQPRVCGFVK